MKKSDLKLLRANMQTALTPPPKPKPDLSDELSSLFDDGRQLQGETTPGSSIAQSGQGSLTAPGSLPSEGTFTALRSHSAQGSQVAQGSSDAQGEKAKSAASARGRATARSSRDARGGKQASIRVAPERDFMKSANSIVRDALREGLFRGKSKQLYDFLYSKTRGAIVPSMSVQMTRGVLMRGSHIGSTHTLRDNLRHLRAVGLLAWEEKAGEQQGNIYFVYLPEEAKLPFDLEGNPVQLSSPVHPDHSGQNLPRPLSAESAQGAQGLSIETTTTSEPSNTFIKDIGNIDDDAVLAPMCEALKEATKEITGRELSVAESGRWKELADVLIAELKIAAARTTISSVPAFLAEHLRRRLWKLDKKQARAEGRELPDETNRKFPAVNAAECPDCGGSGFYYPNGFEAGVVKCRHERLNQSDSIEVPDPTT